MAEWNVTQFQFTLLGLMVDRLQKTMPEFPVYLHARPNNRIRLRIPLSSCISH